MGQLSPEAEHQVNRAARLLAERAQRRTGLRDRAEQAARVLQQEFGAARVWVFGSLGQAWFHEGSDLDLAVEGVAPARLAAAWRRVEELVEGPVDLVSLEEADESLRRRVLERGELLT
jgi:predicted nucleotidyltransferase